MLIDCIVLWNDQDYGCTTLMRLLFSAYVKGIFSFILSYIYFMHSI